MSNQPTPFLGGAHQISRRRALQGSALALGALGLAACSSGSDEASPSTGAGGDPVASDFGFHEDALLIGPLTKPTVAFTDHNGEPFDFAAQTADTLTLLFFGYTSCPDQCPVYLNNIAASIDKLDGPAKFANIVFVGVDTDRDTPAKMKEYLESKNARFIGLTATPEDIDAALAELRQPSVTFDPVDKSGDYFVGHPLLSSVFTPDNLCHIMYPYDLRQSEWVEEMRKLVDYEWPADEMSES